MVQKTPNLELRYPEPGDHTKIWEHIQNLAEDVDSQGGGSGRYVKLAVNGPDVENEPGNPVRLYVAMGVVWIQGSINWKSGKSFKTDQWLLNVGTIPAAYRPRIITRFGCAVMNTQARASNVARIDVHSNGGIHMYHCAGVDGARWMGFNGSWPVAPVPGVRENSEDMGQREHN